MVGCNACEAEVSWLGVVDRVRLPGRASASGIHAAISPLTVAGAAPVSHRLPCRFAGRTLARAGRRRYRRPMAQYDVTLAAARDLTPAIRELVLKSKDGAALPSYGPGAHIESRCHARRRDIHVALLFAARRHGHRRRPGRHLSHRGRAARGWRRRLEIPLRSRGRRDAQHFVAAQRFPARDPSRQPAAGRGRHRHRADLRHGAAAEARRPRLLPRLCRARSRPNGLSRRGCGARRRACHPARGIERGEAARCEAVGEEARLPVRGLCLRVVCSEQGRDRGRGRGGPIEAADPRAMLRAAAGLPAGEQRFPCDLEALGSRIRRAGRIEHPRDDDGVRPHAEILLRARRMRHLSDDGGVVRHADRASRPHVEAR